MFVTLPSKLLQVESLFRFVCIYTGRGKYWIIDEEDKVDTCGVIGVDAASDEEDKVNKCGVVDVDVDAASDEDRVDTCGVIDVDADPATGNDKADTDTWSVGGRMGEVTAISEELDWPSCAD